LEELVEVDGAQLCAETFGVRGDQAILLIAGMSSPMDWWDDALCERLAAGRRYVVRYDQRDTGRSTTCPPGRPDYTGADLVGDVVSLLDAYDIERAHLLGLSMGGALAQIVALSHRDRVRTLTLVSTTPALDRPPNSSALPSISADLAAYFEQSARMPPLDWSDRAAVVERLVADQRAHMGTGYDARQVRALAARAVARTRDPESCARNHALLDPGLMPAGALADLTVPTLVVHGTADPLIPVPHGEALAREIPGATLLTLDGVGHEVSPPATYDVVVPAVLAHTA